LQEHFTFNIHSKEPDSAISVFEASSATLLKVCRVGPKA